MSESESTKQLLELGRRGLIGVFLALIILSGYCVYSVVNLSNKAITAITDNTRAVAEMTGMLQSLRGSLSIKSK